MRWSHPRALPRHGFTLIEVLAALAIAALVAAVLFAAYRTVVRTSERHGGRDRAAAEAVAAMDRVARDLSGAFHVSSAPSLRFILGTEGRSARLALCTAAPPPSDPDLRWFSTERVEYFLRDGNLYRVSHPLPREEGTAAETNLTARSLQRIEAHAWSGDTWTNAWPLGEASAPLPRAVRLRVISAETADAATPTYETEVYVPAGNVFTSSVIRSGAGPLLQGSGPGR